MSVQNVKEYLRTRLTSLGYKEWSDGFNTDNIPSTLLNKSFHLELISSSSGTHDNKCLSLESAYLIRLFLKGFRNPRLKLDEALDMASAVIEDMVSSPQRTAEPSVWNVKFNSLDVRPIESNDNAIIIELGFTGLTFIDTI